MRFESQSSTEHCIDDVHSNTSMLFCLSVCMKKNTYIYVYFYRYSPSHVGASDVSISRAQARNEEHRRRVGYTHARVDAPSHLDPPRDRTSERDVSRACIEHAQHGEVTYKRRRRHTRLANAPQQLLRAVVVAAAACCFACRAACGTPCGISIEPVRSIAPGTSCGSTGNGPRAREEANGAAPQSRRAAVPPRRWARALRLAQGRGGCFDCPQHGSEEL